MPLTTHYVIRVKPDVVFSTEKLGFDIHRLAEANIIDADVVSIRVIVADATGDPTGRRTLASWAEGTGNQFVESASP